jgi:hypothetical protein
MHYLVYPRDSLPGPDPRGRRAAGDVGQEMWPRDATRGCNTGVHASRTEAHTGWIGQC